MFIPIYTTLAAYVQLFHAEVDTEPSASVRHKS